MTMVWPTVWHNLLQRVSSIKKCDRSLLQSASGITKWDSYYKVRSYKGLHIPYFPGMLVVPIPLYMWRQKLENSLNFSKTWKPTSQLMFSSLVNLIIDALLEVGQLQKMKIRSSHRRCFIKKAVLKIFAIFTAKHMCWSLFSINCQAWRPTALLKRDSNTGVFL